MLCLVELKVYFGGVHEGISLNIICNQIWSTQALPSQVSKSKSSIAGAVTTTSCDLFNAFEEPSYFNSLEDDPLEEDAVGK